ncbi:hypothetical protein KKB55_17655 [Myxococcota bacterium]|nr:hypothetical protein [Myxococcota bacterium]MBU1899570.1 hypothetical protein [Myxococcota bacterium]
MDFNCAKCGAPHAFPENQIGPDGLKLSCFSCGAKITLHRGGVVLLDGAEAAPTPPPSASRGDDEMPATDPPVELAPEPRVEPTPEVIEVASEPPAPVSAPPAPVEPVVEAVSEPPKAVEPAVEPVSEPVSAPPAPVEPVAEGLAPVAAPAAMGFFGLAKSQITRVASTVSTKSKQRLEIAAAAEIAAKTEIPSGLSFPGAAPTPTGPWTWRDLPTAFIALFDLRRLVFTTLGLWAALVAFGLVQWLASWLRAQVVILGALTSVLGFVALFSIAAFVLSVMSFVVQKSVIERQQTTIKEGIAWSKRWLKSVVGTPLAFVVVFGGVVILQSLISMLGHIPGGVGAVLLGALTPIIVLLGLLAGATVIAALYALPLYLSVIYDRKGSAYETLVDLFALFKDHGSRLLGHTLLSMGMIGATAAVTVIPACRIGARLTSGVMGYALREQFAALLSALPHGFVGFVHFAFGKGLFYQQTLGFADSVGALLMGIGAAAGLALVLSLVLLSYMTAGAITYNIVLKRDKP